jgi:DNA repair protein RecO (recombination protein O)
MGIQKTEGIILRRQDLRETSLILTFYTRDFGKIKCIARGVRGPRSQIVGGGSFELLACDDIVFYERKHSEFYTLSQCDLEEFFSPIRSSLDKLAYACYIVELLDSVTSLADTNLEVFDLLLNSLGLMAGEASPKRVARIFEIKLLGLLGLMPSLDRCVSCGKDPGTGARFSLRHGGLVCKNCTESDRAALAILPGTAKFIEHIRLLPFEKVERIKVAREVGKELENILRRYLDYQIERRLKTVGFIKEIEK